MLDLGELIENFPYVIPRDPASVIKRYIDAHDDEIETFEDKLDEVMDSHQIDNATGDELDEIGKIFGRLGKREGRDDQDYRIYLKTIVQAFNGRGTVPGIISAVAAGLGEPEENIEVTEDYQNLEYDIIIKDWPSHKGSTVEELADLADASVAQLNKTIYKIEEDETGISDTINTTVSTKVAAEDISIDDAVSIDTNKFVVADELGLDDEGVARRRGVTDITGINDTPAINQNQQVITDDTGLDDTAVPRREGVTDTTGTDDTAAIDQNQQTVSDGAGANDDVQSSQTNVAWDAGSWDDMNWAKNR
jgi:hypothetical protein